MEMCGPHMEECGYISLGRDTEYFNSFTHVQRFIEGNEEHSMELLPLVSASGMSMHYVYPHLFHDSYERVQHKLDILRMEKRAGREYIIKVMYDSVTIHMLQFFSDRPFVITKREDVKGAALSLILAFVLGTWHKRDRNASLYDSLYDTPITIENDLIDYAKADSINALENMYRIIDVVESRGFKSFVYDYDDLKTFEQRASALNNIFGEKDWADGPNVTRDIQADYSKIFKNYDKIIDKLS